MTASRKRRDTMSQPIVDTEKKLDLGEKRGDVDRTSVDSIPVSTGKGDILSLEHTDPVLNAKMHLINDVRSLSAVPSSAPRNLALRIGRKGTKGKK